MDIEEKNINELRILAIDMIEKANSGHPGIALGSAPILYALYSKILNVVPDDDKNILRDRFVLSAGHGSSIYYATMFAFGYKFTIEDLKNFRKLGSKTPGHPEVNLVPGVDASTGPLGQGIAMAVGLAIAERIMANKFNKPDITLFDNYTYVLAGEGCLMEGVSYEALALAGSLNLNKLIVLYDCNKITIDGNIDGVMNQNILGYMKSLNFNTLEVEDGNNCNQIIEAINIAKKSNKPTFIKINTHIGFGSVYENSNKAHGQVLGKDNVKLLRKSLNVNTQPFEFSKDVERDFKIQRKRFTTIKDYFKEKIKAYSKNYPGDYKLLKEYLNNEHYCLDDLYQNIKLENNISGREIASIVLNSIGSAHSNLICGAADVSNSTKVKYENSGFFNDNFSNRNIKFGIREFGMGCISNGISLYGGLIPINSTFLAFSDYMKSALRMTSLMKIKSISIFSHDSIAVGEDGATHQSSEQLNMLRTTPNTYVFRPSNLTEMIFSFEESLNHNGASVIAVSRQKMKLFDSSKEDVKMGGYVVSSEYKGDLNGVIIATGSEVGLALDVKEELMRNGFNTRVVSIPCTQIFEQQSDKYKNSIIPNKLKSVFVIEAGNSSYWYKYVGKTGKIFGVDSFGGSGNEKELYEYFKLTKSNISKEIISVIKKNKDKIIWGL